MGELTGKVAIVTGASKGLMGTALPPPAERYHFSGLR